MITAVVVLIVVFFGISLIVATAGTAILVASGKITLPYTNHRKVMRERAALTVLQIKVEQESLNLRLDETVQRRLTMAAEGPRPFATDLEVIKDFHPDPKTWGTTPT